jgi:hypothetical protein
LLYSGNNINQAISIIEDFENKKRPLSVRNFEPAIPEKEGWIFRFLSQYSCVYFLG